MKEKNTSAVPVVCLPQGCFEGNCFSCIYANFRDKKDDGRIHCESPNYGGYNFPENRNGCFYYEER